MEPGSEGQLVVTLQNDGPNDTICISGKDDQDIFFDFDDEQWVGLHLQNPASFASMVIRVVRFATVFEFLTGDEICVTVPPKKLKSKKSRILNQI